MATKLSDVTDSELGLGTPDAKAEERERAKAARAAIVEAIAAVDDDIYPSDPESLLDFLTVAQDQEAKSFKAYLKLKAGIGRKLEEAHRAYMTDRERTSRLYARLTGVPITPRGDGGGY